MTAPDLTVYHDGSCPLCRLEIDYYRNQHGAERIEFVDVSDPQTNPGPGLNRRQALRTFHARLPSGELKAGASAFIEIWKVLPRWKAAADFAQLPGITPALDVGYKLFQPLRPVFSRVVGAFSQR